MRHWRLPEMNVDLLIADFMLRGGFGIDLAIENSGALS
jgi:hypothetical protein